MRWVKGSAATFVLGSIVWSCTGTDNLTGGETRDGGSEAATPDASSPIDGGTDGASATVDEQCTAFATAYCAKQVSCAPGTVNQTFGGPTTCNERQKASCLNIVELPGSNATTLAACAADISKMSCSDVLNAQQPASCRPSGSLDDGATCVSDQQCKSTYCANPTTTGCGKCAPRAASGGTCTETDGCNAGLVCASGECRAPVQLGGSCAQTNACSAEFFCNTTTGKCEAYRKENESCDPSMNMPCDTAKGFTCPQPNGSCVAFQWVQPGSPCVSGGSCSGGMCRPVGAPPVPTCAAFGKAGDSCANVGCGFPFVCIAGQCVLKDPAFCAQ